MLYYFFWVIQVPGNHPKERITNRDIAPSRVRVDQRVSAVRAVEVPVLVCLRSS